MDDDSTRLCWNSNRLPASASAGYNNCAVDTGYETLNEPFNAKFPYLANIFQMGNVYRSNYNGLQVTLNARNYHGLSMVAGYTYSHALDDVGANWDFGYGSGLPQNAHNVAAEYASSDFDMRHRLTVSLTYAIPGRSGFGQMREGWEINSIITLESPQPWGPMDEGTDAAGVGPLPVSPPANSPIRWSFYRSEKPRTSSLSPEGVGIPYFSGKPELASSACVAVAGVDGRRRNSRALETASLNLFGCYANGSSVMIPPPLGQFGNMSRNMFEDTGFQEFRFLPRQEFPLWRNHAAAGPHRVLQYPQPSELRQPLRRTEWIWLERSVGSVLLAAAAPRRISLPPTLPWAPAARALFRSV